MLKSPPSALRPAAAVLGFGSLALAALLVALLVGVGDARAESAARSDGAVAGSAAGKPRAVAACMRYKRAKRHLQRAPSQLRGARGAHTPAFAPSQAASRAPGAHRSPGRAPAPAAADVRACPAGQPRHAQVRPTGTPGPGVSRPRRASAGACTRTAGAAGAEGPVELDRMQAMGVGWIREEFDSVPDGEYATSLYANAARRGLRILPLLQKSSALPADVNEYESVVARLRAPLRPGRRLLGRPSRARRLDRLDPLRGLQRALRRLVRAG